MLLLQSSSVILAILFLNVLRGNSLSFFISFSETSFFFRGLVESFLSQSWNKPDWMHSVQINKSFYLPFKPAFKFLFIIVVILLLNFNKHLLFFLQLYNLRLNSICLLAEVYIWQVFLNWLWI